MASKVGNDGSSTLSRVTMKEKDFYLQTAIAAMQGIQEGGNYLGVVSDFIPSTLAKKAFNIADEMLKEAKKRGIKFSSD